MENEQPENVTLPTLLSEIEEEQKMEFEKPVETTEIIEDPIKQDTTSENKPERDELGRLMPGSTANPEGRPVLTEEEKMKKKAEQEALEILRKEALDKIKSSYLEGLANALPEISPKLLEQAQEGNIQAIKEVHDRVFGKAKEHKQIDANINGKIEGAKEVAELMQKLDDEDITQESTDPSIEVL